jgi:formylglycine-generating enzyme required for sulfatase activity
VLVPSPGAHGVTSIRLPRTTEIPAGFVYIPAGPVAYGGDSVAFQSLVGGEKDVDGFLIGRREITLGEYLKFLNDPDVVTDDLGFYEPRTAGVRELLLQTAERRIHLVPSSLWRKTLKSDYTAVKKESLYLTKNGGTWEIGAATAHVFKVTSPVVGIPQIAGLEYADWRTEKEGRQHRYRLATDREWEKAARGVDRRIYVWGDYLVRSFCWSSRGIHGRKRIPHQTERFPLDESVYGVRDLAGSVEEYTSSEISPLYPSRRGGSWSNVDDTHFRAATRSSRLAYGRGADAGFRLVIELDPESPTAP